MTSDADGEFRTWGQRQADALVDVCRWFLDHQDAQTGRRNRPHLNVVLDLDEIAKGLPGQLVDGGLLPALTVERLLCDCTIHRTVVKGRSQVIDYGLGTRTISKGLWNLLVLRDGHCRHPGCDRKPAWCEAHHVIPWQKGGETKLANLVLKCSRHHHIGHLPGWSERMDPTARW